MAYPVLKRSKTFSKLSGRRWLNAKHKLSYDAVFAFADSVKKQSRNSRQISSLIRLHLFRRAGRVRLNRTKSSIAIKRIAGIKEATKQSHDYFQIEVISQAGFSRVYLD